jgi:hypothetical protein
MGPTGLTGATGPAGATGATGPAGTAPVTVNQEGVFPVTNGTGSTTTVGATSSTVVTTNASTYAVRYIVAGSTALQVVGGDLVSGSWLSQVTSDTLSTAIRQSEALGVYLAAMNSYSIRTTVTHVSDIVLPGEPVTLQVTLIPSSTGSQDGIGDSVINQTAYGRWYAVRA